MPKLQVSEDVSPGDLFWWRVDEPANPMVINLILGVDGELTLAELRDFLRPHILSNIRFQSVPRQERIGGWRPYFLAVVAAALLLAAWSGWWSALLVGLVLGAILEARLGRQWSWVKVPGFALEDHIKLHALPHPTMECLYEFIDQEASTQLPRDRAQWVVYLIHNSPGGSKVFMRLHHVLGDGAGIGAWFYSVCLPEGADPLPEAAKPEQPPTRPAGVLSLLDRGVMTVLLMVWSVWKVLALYRDSNSPLKGPLRGQKRTAIPTPAMAFPLEEVRRVGKALDPNITVNDTLCALLAGAFRRYFQSLHLHPDQMLMRTTMPINTRRSQGPARMENQFTVMFKSLPIHLPTAAERLAHFHLRMGLMKQGIEAPLGALLQRVFTWLPESVIRLLVLRFVVCSSAVVTNVNGTVVPFVMCGQEVTYCHFWVPSSGDLGIGVSMVSYVGMVYLNLISDAALVEDWGPFVRYLSQEWEEMKGLLTDGGATRPAVKVPRTTAELLRVPRDWSFPWNCR